MGGIQKQMNSKLINDKAMNTHFYYPYYYLPGTIPAPYIIPENASPSIDVVQVGNPDLLYMQEITVKGDVDAQGKIILKEGYRFIKFDQGAAIVLSDKGYIELVPITSIRFINYDREAKNITHTEQGKDYQGA